jgi:uncharacterized protein YjiS (DUF1127 family)
MVASVTTRDCAGMRETGTRRALRLVWQIVAWPVQAWRIRQEYAVLAGMSEHELRDIGLSRQDVIDASAYKAGEDPTQMLATRAEERRRWSRRH